MPLSSCAAPPPQLPINMLTLGAEAPAHVKLETEGGDPAQLTSPLELPFFIRGVAGDERLSIHYNGQKVFDQALSVFQPGQLNTAEIPPSTLSSGTGAVWTLRLKSCVNACSYFGSTTQVVVPLAFSGCSDGHDEDGDGRVDFPQDPDCAAPTDVDELPEPSVSAGLMTGFMFLATIRLRRSSDAEASRIDSIASPHA